MNWLSRKLDTLAGAVFAGVFGAAASQLDAFVLQYLQRLGGHLDEARRHHRTVLDSDRYRQMAADTRAVLLEDAERRVGEIESAFRAIVEADALRRPFAFFAHLDLDVAQRTWEQFRPVLPVDLAGLVYAASGLLLGLVVYELIKAPFAVATRRIARKRALAKAP